MAEVALRRVGAGEREVLGRLWLMFRHDLSEFQGQLPDADGQLGAERLREAYTGTDRVPYLLMLRDRPVGLAVVRGLDGPARIMNAFFVVRAARRGGLGLDAVRQLVAAHPGRWEIPFQDANTGAVRFWRRVAQDLAGDAWTEERRPVPGRPGVPPDVWIGFTA